MPASSSRPSSPAPPTAPATPSSAVSTPRRLRRRRLLPSSRPPGQHSPSIAPASPFSFFPPTSPSPFHRFLPSPLALRSSSVPFSWEHRPGIPKTPARNRCNSKGMNKALPLPPSLLSRSCGGADPYGAVVPAEYAAMHHPPPGRLGGKVRRRSRRPRLGLGDALAEWLSVLSLYRSCKRAAACFAPKASKAPVV